VAGSPPFYGFQESGGRNQESGRNFLGSDC